MLRLGTGWEPPIRGSEMFERFPRPNLTDFFHFFCKKHMAYPFPNITFFLGVHKFFFPPQNWTFFLGTTTFPKLRGFCQNWGAGLWEDLGDLAWSSILLAVDRGGFCQNWGALAKIEGLGSPSMLENGPTPNKNGQLGGQKHLKNAPIFFHSLPTYAKFTFCKKNGLNRPIQPSAVVRIFHCRLYGVATTN